jgi:hypothetical protein
MQHAHYMSTSKQLINLPHQSCVARGGEGLSNEAPVHVIVGWVTQAAHAHNHAHQHQRSHCTPCRTCRALGDSQPCKPSNNSRDEPYQQRMQRNTDINMRSTCNEAAVCSCSLHLHPLSKMLPPLQLFNLWRPLASQKRTSTSNPRPLKFTGYTSEES